MEESFPLPIKRCEAHTDIACTRQHGPLPHYECGGLIVCSQELIYTSAPQGLMPGSHGFCTVASTAGMPKNLAERLESFSGYRHVFPPNDANAIHNPVVYSHLRIVVGGRPYHVLSRISAAGNRLHTTVEQTRASYRTRCTRACASGPSGAARVPRLHGYDLGRRTASDCRGTTTAAGEFGSGHLSTLGAVRPATQGGAVDLRMPRRASLFGRLR